MVFMLGSEKYADAFDGGNRRLESVDFEFHEVVTGIDFCFVLC
ncbi:hypothetical protein SAMN05421858_2997 [Haladaptatus litoreus]|uniref:Uncharacterized protein n=1 Tax=Haladaptatus litoreus TaxID=553468 RepID=A0A1N7CHF6_9EURY|nr:hypothetical protein SAMN05421858_2997 [Haladaptatus litoreus]